MKKTLVITILFVMVALFATTFVNAATSSELAGLIYDRGSKYGVTAEHKAQMERYLEKYPVTDAQANAVLEKVDEVVNVFNRAGVTDIAKLSAEDLKTVQTLANQAAAIVDVQVVWSGSSATILHDGVTEDVINFSDKLAYTGNETNIALVVSSVAVVALTAGIIARKKLANA